MATLATNPPKSFRTAHLIEIEEPSAEDGAWLHGYTVTAAAPAQSDAPTLVAEERKSGEWDPETARLIEWFLAADVPNERFELHRGVVVADPARWWPSIKADIAAGPRGPRGPVLPSDLRAVHALFADGDDHG